MRADKLMWCLLIFTVGSWGIEGTRSSPRMLNIFWNASNPMFRIDNNDNVFDINAGNQPFEYDQANIICPTYPVGTAESQVERSIVYMVTRDEYDNCRIGNPHPRVIAVCNQPHDIMYVTITFRSFTPTPGGLEFKPGHDYFFISTSTRHDLHRRFGGRCSADNMKIMFKIAHNKLYSPKLDQKAAATSSQSSSATLNQRREPGSDPATVRQRHLAKPSITFDDDIDSNALEERHRSERRHSSESEDQKLRYFAKTAIKQEASVMQPTNPSQAPSHVSRGGACVLAATLVYLVA